MCSLTVYFGGDSALDHPSFLATHKRFPHIDLALMQICPIHPRDFMKATHMDPGEALDAFSDLGADFLVPIHYDTFVNSDDAPGECPATLRRIARERGLEARVSILEVGEQHTFIP